MKARRLCVPYGARMSPPSFDNLFEQPRSPALLSRGRDLPLQTGGELVLSKWSSTSLRSAFTPARSLSNVLRALVAVACSTGCAAAPVNAPRASGTQDCAAAPASAPKA